MESIKNLLWMLVISSFALMVVLTFINTNTSDHTIIIQNQIENDIKIRNDLINEYTNSLDYKIDFCKQSYGDIPYRTHIYNDKKQPLKIVVTDAKNKSISQRYFTETDQILIRAKDDLEMYLKNIDLNSDQYIGRLSRDIIPNLVYGTIEIYTYNLENYDWRYGANNDDTWTLNYTYEIPCHQTYGIIID